MKIKKTITLILSTSSMFALSACNGGQTYPSKTNTATSINAQSNTNIATDNMTKAAYVDITASGSFATIPTSGFASANVLLFAFADLTSTTIPTAQAVNIKTAMLAKPAGTTTYLLSLGGALATPSLINMSTTKTVINNVIMQINNYNATYGSAGKITGVDLDLENDITSEVIAELAKGFKAQGLTVTAAPQVYLNSGTNIDSKQPTNLVLTSGGNQNTYQMALNAGNIDTLFVQPYNTSGFTIDGIDEADVHFIKNTAKALNNVVNASCSGSNTICIPEKTQILIGTVANKGAGWYSMFQNNTSAADQQNTLNTLASDIALMKNNNPDYSHINGIMVWSLGNDYDPKDYSSPNAATPGAFSTTIFGASAVPDTPYFIMQITNTGPNQASNSAYASITLVVNDQYFQFGNKWNQPITPQASPDSSTWGTLPSASASVLDDSNSIVTDSPILDNLFNNGATKFTTSAIIINGYANNKEFSPSIKPVQKACAAGVNKNFLAGHSYNIMVNPVTGACQITDNFK